AIAKRIEAGREAMIAGLCESPLTFQAIIIWREELNTAKVFLRDIIDLEATYAGPDAKNNMANNMANNGANPMGGNPMGGNGAAAPHGAGQPMPGGPPVLTVVPSAPPPQAAAQSKPAGDGEEGEGSEGQPQGEGDFD